MLVSSDMLVDHMSGIDLDDYQEDDANVVLAGVQAQLEKYLNRPLEPVLVREARRTEWDGTIRYSQSPVLRIVSVQSSNGAAVPLHGDPVVPSVIEPLTETATDALGIDRDRVYDRVGNTFFAQSPINPGDFYVGPPGQWFVVTYIAGYIGNKDHFIKGILDVAARVMTHNHDDSVSIKEGVTQDDTDTSVTSLSGLYWQMAELQLFDRDRRRVIV